MKQAQGNFFDLTAILSHHQPPAFVLENVKHLQSSPQRRRRGISVETNADENSKPGGAAEVLTL